MYKADGKDRTVYINEILIDKYRFNGKNSTNNPTKYNHIAMNTPYTEIRFLIIDYKQKATNGLNHIRIKSSNTTSHSVAKE